MEIPYELIAIDIQINIETYRNIFVYKNKQMRLPNSLNKLYGIFNKKFLWDNPSQSDPSGSKLLQYLYKRIIVYTSNIILQYFHVELISRVFSTCPSENVIKLLPRVQSVQPYFYYINEKKIRLFLRSPCHLQYDSYFKHKPPPNSDFDVWKRRTTHKVLSF